MDHIKNEIILDWLHQKIPLNISELELWVENHELKAKKYKDNKKIILELVKKLESKDPDILKEIIEELSAPLLPESSSKEDHYKNLNEESANNFMIFLHKELPYCFIKENQIVIFHSIASLLSNNNFTGTCSFGVRCLYPILIHKEITKFWINFIYDRLVLSLNPADYNLYNETLILISRIINEYFSKDPTDPNLDFIFRRIKTDFILTECPKIHKAILNFIFTTFNNFGSNMVLLYSYWLNYNNLIAKGHQVYEYFKKLDTDLKKKNWILDIFTQEKIKKNGP